MSRGRDRPPALAILAATASPAVAAVFLLPNVEQSPAARARSLDQHHLKRIGRGLRTLAEDGGSPPAVAGPPVAWATALLPDLGERELAALYDPAAPFDAPANAAAVATEVDALLTPHRDWRDRRGEGGFGLSHYAGNVRVLGPGGVRRRGDVTDGLSETILAGGVGGFPRPWADPANLRDAAAGVGTGPRQFGGPYGGVQVVLCDGSVRFVDRAVDPAAFAALGAPAGSGLAPPPPGVR